MVALSDNVRGAALMTASMAGFVVNDALVKLVSGDLSVFQVMFVRGLFATALMAVLAWRLRALWPKVPRGDWRLLAMRMGGEACATSSYLTALFHMPLANATAILQALPLAVTLGAAVFLREPVGWRRYLAIAVGFAGVLVIVRPGAEGFNTYAGWALAAVGFITLRDLATRKLSTHVPSLFAALLSAAAITVTGAVLTPTVGWRPIGLGEVQVLAAAALFINGGYLFGTMAMRVGDISFNSPFRYSVLLWAIILGYLVFGDVPDAWTLVGSAVVVIAGLYTFARERQLAVRGGAA